MAGGSSLSNRQHIIKMRMLLSKHHIKYLDIVGCACSSRFAFKNKCWFSGFQLETSTPPPICHYCGTCSVQSGLAHYYKLSTFDPQNTPHLFITTHPFFLHVLQKSFQAPVVVLLLLLVSLQLTGCISLPSLLEVVVVNQ